MLPAQPDAESVNVLIVPHWSMYAASFCDHECKARMHAMLMTAIKKLMHSGLRCTDLLIAPHISKETATTL